MLKINGRCGVVLPDGQELFNKNSSLVAMRKLLLKTCNLEEIVLVPGGIFTNTSIKTCILFFTKKKEVNDALELKVKLSKSTQQEISRKYKFTNDHSTEKVKFSEFNPEIMERKEILTVHIDEISSNNYSLNYQEYVKEEEKKYDDSIEVKTLGDICTFIKGPKRKISDQSPIGMYKFITCSIMNHLYIDNYDYEDDALIINAINGSGKCMIYYASKYSTTTNNIHFRSTDDNVLNKYLYYYLYNNIFLLENGFKGSNQKKITKEYVFKIKIPIPPIERQKEMVELLDYIYEECIETSLKKMEQLNKLNEYYLRNQIRYGYNEIKTLGEVCDINPENMKKNEYDSINYIDISSVNNNLLKDVKKLTKFPSRAKRKVRINDILYSSVRPNLYGYMYMNMTIKNCIASTGFAIIRKKKDIDIIPKYIYYSLIRDEIKKYLVNKAKGAQYPTVSFSDFAKIKIPIPSLERQKEIVDYFENNEDTINKLNKEIEGNKMLALNIINSINKSDDDTTDEEDE
jgi:type I restriction enzyme S subunit